MKKQLFSLIAVWGLAAAVTPLFAQSTGGMRATIPFEFIVGTRTMPAGVYIVEPNPQWIRITSLDRKNSILQTTQTTELPSPTGGAAMIFTQYGDTRFLSRVKTSARVPGHKLLRSDLEKELSAKLPAKEVSTTLQASSR